MYSCGVPIDARADAGISDGIHRRTASASVGVSLPAATSSLVSIRAHTPGMYLSCMARNRSSSFQKVFRQPSKIRTLSSSSRTLALAKFMIRFLIISLAVHTSQIKHMYPLYTNKTKTKSHKDGLTQFPALWNDTAVQTLQLFSLCLLQLRPSLFLRQSLCNRC